MSGVKPKNLIVNFSKQVFFFNKYFLRDSVYGFMRIKVEYKKNSNLGFVKPK
jgi:hypothetical protein